MPGARPTPTPSRGSSRGGRPTPTVAPVSNNLNFNLPLKGRLDPKSSTKAPNGNSYEEYLLKAKSTDLLGIQFQSDDESLYLQIFDKENNEIPLARDFTTGGFKIDTRNQGLPKDGEYRVRVSGLITGKSVLPFTVTVNRLGLVQDIYNERFQQIVGNFRESDPASVDDTMSKLLELATDDSFKPGAFEYLGLIYLYHRRNLEKAEFVMEQAIRANGAALIKISFDSQWRQLARSKSGEFNWQDPRSGWLRIRPNQLTITDPSQKELASVAGAKITEVARGFTGNNNLVKITADGVRKPYIFLPDSKEQGEAELVIKLIQNHVMRKNN
ncbi:MAG TPA: hypothetical protein VJ302_32170 [Blastocatellia bacterium]|nr:hypothetical protein [Blastocatellia bacterium]